MAINPDQLSQDKDFIGMSPQDQTGYLSSQDPDFAKMAPADQAGYISHITGKPFAPAAPPTFAAPPGTPGVPKPSVQPETSMLGTIYGQAKNFADNAAQTMGAPPRLKDYVEGPQDAIAHPIDSAKLVGGAMLDSANQASQGGIDKMKQPGIQNKLQGGLEYLEASIPGVGPSLVNAGRKAQAGDYSGAAGITAGIAAPAVAGKLAPAAIDATTAALAPADEVLAQRATSDFTKAIPPTKSVPYAPADYQAARPYLESEHAGLPIKSVDDVRGAADASVKKIESQVQEAVAKYPPAQITTQPLAAVHDALAPIDAIKSGFLKAGLKEMEPYHLDQPMTLAKADAMRRQLNAENSAYAASNKYDVAQARATSPAYAAREAAVSALRDGVYDGLDKQGFHDAAKLRQDEGSLLRVRDAAQNQMFNGEKKVSGTGASSGLVKTLIRLAGTGGGAALGDAIGGGGGGAAAGGVLGAGAAEAVNSKLFPGNLTRDGLAARSFSVKPGMRGPVGATASAAVPDLKLTHPPGETPQPPVDFQRVLDLAGGENIPGKDLTLTHPPGDMPPALQRVLPYQDPGVPSNIYPGVKSVLKAPKKK